MKEGSLMSNEERAEYIREKVIINATALNNACKTVYKDNNCSGCPFYGDGGCDLFGRPLEWDAKLKSVKAVNTEGLDG